MSAPAPKLGFARAQARVRARSYQIMGGSAVFFTIWVLFSEPTRMIAKGPANIGHETLHCGDCHQLASGTVRQRAQAIVGAWLGQRQRGSSPVYQPVNNQHCDACHQRSGDVHAPHLFNEPRFADARATADPRRCVTCHAEHQGTRVTRDGSECQHCHQDVKLRDDPLERSHEELAQAGEWLSCLTCHDYHGGHAFSAPERSDQALKRSVIDAYLRGDTPSPYGPPLNVARKSLP